MTETILKKKMFERFETLNEFSGLVFLKNNVSYPNKTFNIPEKKTWYKIDCTFDEPYSNSLGMESQNRWVGIFQIDVYTPIGKGEDEFENNYKWIAELFKRGTEVDDIIITKVYRANSEVGDNYYRNIIRVEFNADLDN